MEASATARSREWAWLDWLIARPAVCVALLAAVQALVWTLAPALTHSAPPLDVAESYLWGQEWVVGSFKHPNMPGWVLDISRRLTGAVGWPAYFASQLFVGATFTSVFLLGREMFDDRRALAATLLLTGVFYFAWPTIEFNHNVAQMPFWALIALLVWRLRTRPELGWWLVLGVVGAASLYAKLSSALLLFVAGVWIVSDPLLRRQLRKPAPWFGLLAFACVSAPLFAWLLRTHFGPLLYAAERSNGADQGPLQFVGAQALACVGLVLLAAIAGLNERSSTQAQPALRHCLSFLATMTFAPIAITALLAAVSGSGLKSMWGTPMLGLTGLLAVALAPKPLSDGGLKRLIVAVAALMLVLPAGYAIDTLYEAGFTGKLKRQNWPQADIAARFDALWRSKTGQPLRIVAGERWVAGLVALRGNSMPSILTDGNFELSPWINLERLHRQGALLIWEQKTPSDAMPPGLAALPGVQAGGSEAFATPRFPGAQPVLIGYAILPPG